MSYESFVENYRTQKRQLIIPWWGFVLAAVFVISVLLLLNQSQEAFAFDLYDQPADETALRYIDNMLQTKPDDMSLRLQRIHQLIGLEELETAREEIDLISVKKNGSSLYWEVLWLRHELSYFDSYFEATKDIDDTDLDEAKMKLSPEETALLLSQIKHLNKSPLSFYKLSILGEQAVNLGDPVLASELYQRMLTITPSTSPRKLVEYAKIALYAENLDLAANYYFQAQRFELSAEGKRRYFIRALEILQSTGVEQSYEQIIETNIGSLKNDRETLLYISRLALAKGDVEMARKYIERIIH
mgnify:CR=1 FL=1